MREYTTQMDAARKGILTEEMKAAAAKEQMEPQELMELMAEGKVIIPCNRLHTCIEPNAIGSMLRTKINVNLGTSRDWKDMDMELLKVNDAVKMGVESIMDLSSFGDTQKFRLSIDPEKARAYREAAKPEKEDTCSMCGNFCAVKNMNRILDGEIVSIYNE